MTEEVEDLKPKIFSENNMNEKFEPDSHDAYQESNIIQEHDWHDTNQENNTIQTYTGKDENFFVWVEMVRLGWSEPYGKRFLITICLTR